MAYDYNSKEANATYMKTPTTPTQSSSGFSALGNTQSTPSNNYTYAPGSAQGPLNYQQQQVAQSTGQAAIMPANGVVNQQQYPNFMDTFNQLQQQLQQQQQINQQQFQALQQQQSDYQKSQAQQQVQQQKQSEQQMNALKSNQQQQLLELRSIANQNNVPIGYSNGQVTLNGQAVNPEDYGLQNVNGRYMGTSDQIAGILSGGKLQGVRSTLEGQGHNVAYNNGQLSANGIPIDSSNMVNIGGHFYANPETIQDIQTRTGGAIPVNAQGGAQNPAMNSQQSTQQTQEQSQLQELSKMVDEMAKMTPPQTDTKSMVDLLKGLQEYKRPYDDQIKSLLASTMTSFNYNPDNDPLLKKAVDYADKKLMEEMNARGILSSSATADALVKVKTDLIPQYQQMAMDNYYKQLEVSFKQIGIYQQLNQDDYTQYYNMVNKSIDVLNKVNQSTIDTWKNTFTFMSDVLSKKADLVTKEANAKRDDMTMALNKINTLGYVDNETSLITGLPVGTPSYKAQADITARYDEYNKIAIQAKDKKEEIKLQGENAIKEIKAKAEEKNRTDTLMAAATNIDAQLRNVPASQAREYILTNTSEILKTTGSEGYKYLLESVAKREETEFSNQMRMNSDNRANAAAERSAAAAERAANKASEPSARELKAEENKSFGEDYRDLKNMSVADAKKTMTENADKFITAYGHDGYKNLWNSVLSNAIAQDQADEMK